MGAIRWDAWYGEHPGNAGVVGRTVTEDLSYHAGKPTDRWHCERDRVPRACPCARSLADAAYALAFTDRVPFFGKYQSAANKSLVDMNGNTPAAMSAELEVAHRFGIDFWACTLFQCSRNCLARLSMRRPE